MRATRRLIGVAGAGIAGLTAALALDRKGFQVRVFEQRLSPPEEGAGIQISPNAFHVLADLNRNAGSGSLGTLLQSVGFAPERIDLRDFKQAEPIGSFQLGEPFRDRYGAPYLVLARSDLAALLLNACRTRGNIEIKFGARVVEAANHKNGVTAMVEASTESGKLEARETTLMALIGADGVRSAVAGRIRGSERAEFTGHIAWRGLVDIADFPATLPQNTTSLWQLPDAHVVHYPVFQGRMVNVVVIVPHDPHSTNSAQKENRRIEAAGWLSSKERRLPETVRTRLLSLGLTPVLQEIVNSEGTWGGWPLHAHQKFGPWHAGSIGLIGDAAHAMVPYAAQGGCAAIEDAAVLADAFERCDGVSEAAFESYVLQRKPRVKRIMALSQSNRRIYHHGGVIRMARNLVMRHAPASFFEKRMDWLYGWRAE